MRTKRRYRLGKRGERAAETRQRIVEATMELHDEQGISATSVRHVAGRAGVAPSTVLHHFPNMADLIRACGQVSNEMAPMPDAGVLVGASSRIERVRRMAAAMYEWWEAWGPGFDHLRVDRRVIPDVNEWLTDVGMRHRQLAAEAVGDAAVADLLVALTTADAWQALRASGARPEEAGRRVADLLSHDQADASRRSVRIH